VLSKEFKVGILGIAAIAVLYFGINFLSGSDIFRTTNRYFAFFDHIDGLTPSNPVMINGYTVGLVKDIKFLPGKKKPLLVSFDLDKKVQLNDSSIVILANNGLLGGKMLVVEPGFGRKPKVNKDTIVAIVEVDITTQLQSKAMPIVDNLGAIMTTANQLLLSFEGTAQKLNEALDNFSKLSSTGEQFIESNAGNIKKTTGNLADISASLKDTEAQMKDLMVKLNKLGDTLNRAPIASLIKNLESTSKSINKTLDNINQGKGTLGKLAKNDSLYNNLNASSASLNALLQDLKVNPKRYVHFSVFGRKEKKGNQ
jgi:phospholipid/cholesterol/gamma-HCH transport system substrate-binding protein